MRKNLNHELARLEEDLVRLGTMVEEALANAVTSLKRQDEKTARQVVENDDAVDHLAQCIEDDCLRLIALQQPMAGDLRRIGTILKIVTDLERVGDHAVDISRVTMRLAGQQYIKPLIDIPRMSGIVGSMLRTSLDAFVKGDVSALESLNEQDDEVDHLYSQVFRELLIFMMADPPCIPQAMEFLMVASYLERVADHATNIGEWCIYAIKGERPDLNV